MKIVNVISSKHNAQSRLVYVLDFINQHPFTQNRLHFTLQDNNQPHDKLYYGIESINGWKMNSISGILHPNESLMDKIDLGLVSLRIESEIFRGIGMRGFVTISIEDQFIPIDIFSTIFFMISRIEEYTLESDIEDKDLFEAKLWVVRNKLTQIPIVDDLVRLIVKLFTGVNIQQATSIKITHDVDILRKFDDPWVILRKIPGHFLHRKSLSGFPALIKQYIRYIRKGIDPYDTFDWMMESDNKEREIYFLCGGKHHWDTPINLKDPIFKKAISLAMDHGYSIGIHPSYESYRDGNLITTEKEKLEHSIGKEISISRQHFLNFSIGKTPQLLIAQGIKKDSSLGFSRHLGFRCGTGYDYYLYDFKQEKKSDLMESPLVFMDSSCLHYSEYDGQKFVENFQDFFRWNKYNTRITCNFHNSVFDELEMRGVDLKKLYLNLSTV